MSRGSSGPPLQIAIPPLRQTLFALPEADFAILLRNRQALILALVLPLVILIAASLSAGDFAARLGGTAVPLGSSITSWPRHGPSRRRSAF